MDGGARGHDLERRLGLPSVTSLVVANMVGAGIFTTSGLLMGDLPNPVVMLALWVVGGVVALCGALCYGELGAAIPEAGGEYAFLARIFHPAVGFLSGWVSFFAGFSAPIAASVIAVFTALHRRGLELGARVQNLLTGLKVALVIGLVALGFGLGSGSFAHLTTQPAFVGDLAGWKAAGLGLMWIMFAYSGWNAAAYVGSEIRDPRRTLPLGLLLGTGTVTVLYLALNLFYVWAVPAAELAGEVAVAGTALEHAFGPGLDAVVSVLIGFALFSSLSAYLILGPRVYYAMARDGLFFPLAGRVHPRFGVPSGSIVLQGALAMVMVGFGSFDQILTYMGFSLGLFPLAAVAGIVVLRRRGQSPLPMPLSPLPAVVYLAVGATILVLGFMQRPVESSVAVATVAAGVPAYLLFRARLTR